MTERTPPKLATALLTMFGPDGPALTGDLLERYQSGESRWWYWRQVVIAIATTKDRWLIVRGVFVGWMTWRVFGLIVGRFDRDIMGTPVLDWLIVNLGSHPFVMFYAVVLWFRPVEIVGYLFSGWVVGRSHQSCRNVAVFAFTSTVLIHSAWVTARWFKQMTAVYDDPGYVGVQLALAALPLMILLGGRASRHRFIRAAE